MITQATTIKLATFTQERPLITIEFAPKIHPSETEYSYEHPQFVFGDRVILANEYPETEYSVYALELIESKTPSGKLLSQPRWKYKISNGGVCFEKEESALLRYEDKSSPNTFPNTCSTCSNFQDYHDANGRGWCNQFNHQARTHHLKTNNCIISSQTVTQIEEELERPHSEYEIGSIVKVIDPKEHHTEWGIFEVAECKYNHKLYQGTESYLNQTEWYYRLTSVENGGSSFWVAQNEIYDFDMCHNVCTQDIF